MSRPEFEWLKKDTEELIKTAELLMQGHWPSDSAEEIKENLETNVGELTRFREELGKSKKAQVEPVEVRQIEMSAKKMVTKLRIFQKNADTVADRKEKSISKLPKLIIDKFDGDIFKFQQFWQMFETNIHLNDNLSEVDKFNYLVSYLAGKARNVVDSIPIVGENYATAIKKLKERYGDTQIIVGHHYRELTQLTPAKNYALGLQDTLDTIEKHLACLKNLGEDINQRVFPGIIKSKFPRNLIFEIEKSLADDEMANTETLLKLLGKIIKAQVKTYVYENEHRTRENTREHSQDSGKSSGRKFYTTESLLVREGRDNRKRCFYCSKAHWSDECTEFTTLESRKAIVSERCDICLGKHKRETCGIDRACVHCKESKKHHRSLCPKLFAFPVMQAAENRDPEYGMLAASSEKVYMQTFSVEVSGLGKVSPDVVRGMLDSGSQRTYVAEGLSKRLKLDRIRKEILSIYVFGSTQPRQVTSFQVELMVKLRNGSYMKVVANEVPSIMGSFQNSTDLDELKLPKGLKLADLNRDQPIEILIGNDYYHDLVLEEKTKIHPHLYLVNTKLGWVLSGRCQKRGTNQCEETLSFLTMSARGPEVVNNLVAWVEPENLPFPGVKESSSIKGLWDLDTIGIRENPTEIEDDRAVQSFNRSIQKIDKRYQVSWPWKTFPPPELTTNYGLAFGRLKSLLTRIQDKTILAEYNKIFEDQLAKGVIERVRNPFAKEDQNVIHYLPHHPVITPEKSTKVRIVFDGSAKSKKGERSLNECMYRGRVLLEDLVGILLRVRMHEYVVTSDIEKAFLQIALHNHDRDVTRFLWVKNLDNPPTKDNLEVFRFQRVAFGIIASPFLLNAVVKHHLAKYKTQISEKIAQNIYVDNVVVGCDSKQEALNLHEQGIDMFQEANMNLRCWVSNVPELREKVEDRTEDMKILGLNWHIQEDYWSVKSKIQLNKGTTLTKTEVVSSVSSYFDPLGFFNPTLILGKIFIQELWEANMGWDDGLTVEQAATWKKLKPILDEIQAVKVPRKIGKPVSNEVEVHCFTDASQKAYSAAVYIRFWGEGKFVTNLAFSKARVAPRGTTIPRLELLGVLIGVRAMEFVIRSLDVVVIRKCLWTDSKCVLHWIRSGKILPLFVENRIKEINKAKGVCFKFVPSEQNPADLATRGSPAPQLDSFWWLGPQWLVEAEESWPTTAEFETDGWFLEEKVPRTPCFPATEKLESQYQYPFGLLVNNFSSLDVLLNKTAYCYRYIKNLKRKIGNETLELNEVTVDELEDALKLWCRKVQTSYFSNIFEENKSVVRGLGLWLDKEGLIRCKGRVVNLEFTYDENFPMLLPYQDYFTELIIRHYHGKLLHSGVSHTLAEIRKKYWIVKGRALVRKTVARCGVCKRWGGGPYRLPDMPPLPLARISQALPFQNTGLDYLGPLYVKDEGRPDRKVWICLFTCLVTRAIHLEMVASLTAQEFLLALRRFIARRGAPRLIISDNASQFHLVESLVRGTNRKATVDPSIATFLAEQRAEWHFITELAPWAGGVYERLIGLVKGGLRRAIGKKRIDCSHLLTVTLEIESILNSRPLTYVSDDIDSNNILTPSHFLQVRSCLAENNAKNVRVQGAMSATRRELIAHWKRGQALLDGFWKIWKGEYLLSLRERTQRNIRQRRVVASEEPKVGAIVHIGDSSPRGTWRLAKVVELKKGRDGKIRTAMVLLPNHRIVARSLGQLYPLEVPKEDSQPPLPQ